MKKVLISLLTAVMIGSTLTACTSKADNGQKVEQGSKVEFSMPLSEFIIKLQEKELFGVADLADDTSATEIYHLNLDNVEEYVVAAPMINATASFVMIVKAKDGKVEDVKASVEKVLEDQIGNAFYPQQKEAVENATVEIKGNYVSLFIYDAESKEQVEKIYNDSFK